MKLFINGNRKGVITIFLTIILIPTLLFSAVLIDGSRVSSAKAMTQEAADLAAISAAANYNQALKDEFGLFAIDQPENVEALYRESLDATLMAYGFDSNAEYSDTIWQLLKSSVTGTKNYSGADFLNLYDFKVESASVEKLSPLSEKKTLKKQMAEYSKYRGLLVITERLGIFEQLSAAQKQAEENEETSECMEDKMQIDQKNAEADQAVKDLQNAISDFKSAVSSIQTCKKSYIKALDAWMESLYYETITTGEEADKKVTDLAETYPNKKTSFGNSWKTLVNAAKDVRKKADSVYSLSKTAVKNLNNFAKENKNGNDTQKELSKEAEQNAKSYQKYIDAAEKIKKDTKLETLSGLSVNKLKSVLNQIEKAADSDSAIRAKIKKNVSTEDSEEEEEEEITECYYYYLGKNDYSTNIDDVLYGSNAKKNYEPAVEAVYKNYVGLAKASWTNVKLNGAASGSDDGKITEDFASSQSGKTGDSSKEAEGAAKRGEISKDYYSNLPSKQKAEKGNEVKTDFYNTDGDLSKSKNIMNQGKHSMVQDVKTTTLDDLLCLSYMFGTFKTRMTGVEKFSSEKMSDEDKNSFYMPEWRYSHENGELDMRLEPKKDRTTVLRSEIEYLIYGNRTDKGNEAAVYATIYAERLANNMLALYQNGTVRTACHGAAGTASLATLGVVPEPVFFWIFLTAWSIAETVLDMNYLISGGYKIPLFKTSTNLLLSNVPDGKAMITNYGKNGIFVSYEDYLLILLLLKGEDKRTRRCADLIEMNMRKNGADDFKISNAYTGLNAETKMSIRYLFGNAMPFGSSYEENGYSGRITYSNTTYYGY